MGRTAVIERKTKETDISIALDLDAPEYDVKCDVAFLRHMVETLSRYSGIGISLKATGDDDHHLIEDVGIALGSALKSALGDDPICRMSTRTVVMDDAMVMTSIDIIDRPYAEIECPDPLYVHFLRSFAMSSGMTLHTITFRGFDDHHIIEATFKSLGLCLKDAIRPRNDELSTKGSVNNRKK